MLIYQSVIKFLTSNDNINEKSDENNVTCTGQKPEYKKKNTKEMKISTKKLEELMKHYHIVHCAWPNSALAQILFSNGQLVNILFDSKGDIIHTSFDKFLLGKLINDNVISFVKTKKHILVSYDLNQITFVSMQIPNVKRIMPEKISKCDPKIFNIIINGSATKKISRHLACNKVEDLLAVWTKSSQNEVFPWRPSVNDHDRANIHIYKLRENRIDLFCYYWTENDPIDVDFSKADQSKLKSVEQKVSKKVLLQIFSVK